MRYDTGDRCAAEATRQAALSLGKEAGHAEIQGWAHEMRAWFALTTGDYHGAIAADDEGRAVAGRTGVAVQLATQQAKAWTRVGDRRQAEVALDQGRNLLESLPHLDNVDHHFVVEPLKFDFYAMDHEVAASIHGDTPSKARQITRTGGIPYTTPVDANSSYRCCSVRR